MTIWIDAQLSPSLARWIADTLNVTAIIVHDDTEAVLTPVTKSVDAVFGRLHSSAQPRRSVADMKLAVAERIRNHKR